MKSIKLNLILVALTALFSTVAYAGDVVKDTIGTTASSVKSVEALLQGQVAGVRVWSQDGSPLSASGVSIRGVNSLRGGATTSIHCRWSNAEWIQCKESGSALAI